MEKKSRVSNGIDWYNISIEEVFEKLQCSKEGLTSEAVQERLEIFGRNKMAHEKKSNFLKFLRLMCNTRVAATIIAVANGWGKLPFWPLFFAIILLFLLMPILSIKVENDIYDLLSTLMENLTREVKVLRDRRWSKELTSGLVPGDVISFKAGDMIPADARLLEGDPLIVKQSSPTGDSFRVTKRAGDAVYSGSICEQGESVAVIIATGGHTSFRMTAHMVDNPNKVTYLEKVLTATGIACIFLIAVGMLVEIIVMYPFQHRTLRVGINNLLVLLIGGFPTMLQATVLFTIFFDSHHLAQKGAILKRMTAVKEMADMDVLCCDTRGTLTLQKLIVDKSLIEVFDDGADANTVVQMAARACKTENHDAIDAAVVGTLADPKEAWTGIHVLPFLSSDATDKQTALTYTNSDGKVYRVCKGSPQQMLDLAHNKKYIERRVHAVTDKFTYQGWQSLAVAYQEVTDEVKENPESAWKFLGVIPLFNTPRTDSADIVARASDLGINVKMITGDQLAIAKETARCLGMGTNIYPMSSLLGMRTNESISTIPIDELLEKADGFSDVSSEHCYEIVKRLQARKHTCAMTGHDATVVPALAKADIGIAVANATDAARTASDIVLTKHGLDTIIKAVLSCRKISQRIKDYFIHTVSVTIHIVIGFMLLALIWKFDFPPLMMLFIVGLNDVMSYIHRYKVKRCSTPEQWGLAEILKNGLALGGYLTFMTILFFWTAHETDFFQRVFGVARLGQTAHTDHGKLVCAVYLQVCISSQGLIFLTQSRRWSDIAYDGFCVFGFLLTQLFALFFAVENSGWPSVEGISWGWAGVIWLFNITFFIPLIVIKFLVSPMLKHKM